VIPDGLGVKIIKKSDHARQIEEAKTYMTIFYKIENNDIYMINDGILNINNLFGKNFPEDLKALYGYFVVKKSDYTFLEGKGMLDIEYEYEIVDKNGQKDIAKRQPKIETKTTTSSAVVIE